MTERDRLVDLLVSQWPRPRRTSSRRRARWCSWRSSTIRTVFAFAAPIEVARSRVGWGTWR